jgi:hypothetical protein
MELWEVIGAVSSALSLFFAVYIYYNSKQRKLAEKAKNEVYRERLRSLQHNLSSALYSVDSIVQLGKHDSATIEMLQNLARITRGQLYTTIQQIEKERGMLKNWRYGEMIDSKNEVADRIPRQE